MARCYGSVAVAALSLMKTRCLGSDDDRSKRMAGDIEPARCVLGMLARTERGGGGLVSGSHSPRDTISAGLHTYTLADEPA
jgi:hypothetical protein